MSTRRFTNNIHALINENGDFIFKPEEIEHQAIHYFTGLFNGHHTAVFSHFQTTYTINTVAQHILLREITMDEIQTAVFSVHDDSSLGPYDINAKSFKIHWDSIKLDFLYAFVDMFKSAKIPKGVNHTFITLVPKSDESTSISH